MLDPDTADLSLLQDRQVAVLGYDAVAAAHALNLRDSGVDVRVGVDPDSRGAARAEADGLTVLDPAAAADASDILLVPTGRPGTGHGEHDPALVARLLADHTEPGDLVVVTSGIALDSTGPVVPDGVDLVMVHAMADGRTLREEYLDGRGCPALVAVERDGSGAAWATLTAYAAAMGSLRSGAVITTLAHHALAERFADVAVHGVMQQVVETAFDTLVQAGVEPEVAYLATVHELKARTDQVYAAGYASQHGPHGRGVQGVRAQTLLPGLPAQMADLLGRLRDADPAEGTGVAGGEPSDTVPSSRRAAAQAAHPVEKVGRRVRSMMSWIR
jgi:ketol-acid reductoisomerase